MPLTNTKDRVLVNSLRKVLASIGLMIFCSTAAHAYVGPGVGLSAIGSALGLLFALLLAIVGFLWFPLKRLFKKKQDAQAQMAESAADAETTQEANNKEESQS